MLAQRVKSITAPCIGRRIIILSRALPVSSGRDIHRKRTPGSGSSVYRSVQCFGKTDTIAIRRLSHPNAAICCTRSRSRCTLSFDTFCTVTIGYPNHGVFRRYPVGRRHRQEATQRHNDEYFRSHIFCTRCFLARKRRNKTRMTKPPTITCRMRRSKPGDGAADGAAAMTVNGTSCFFSASLTTSRI